MKHIAVVGASLAGLSAARALRSQGFDGRLTIVGGEAHRPYDRPPLSKQVLAGTLAVSELDLERPDEDLAADWWLGVRATAVQPHERSIELADGRRLTVDGIVLTTGATARRLGPARAGVHVVRTVEDSLALRAELQPGADLVVIGGGFIGAEVAATASALGVHATVVEVAPTPLAAALGPEMGERVAGLHARHGVTLHCGTGVTRIVGDQHVTGVELADGRVLPADVVVVGIGATPDVQWLHGSGVAVDDGIRCDATGGTSVPNVVAAGDCAAWLDPATGTHRRTEHWTSATTRPAIAVTTLLGGEQPDVVHPAERAPYFWSEQYGIQIQFAGHTQPGDDVEVEISDPDSGSFLAVYRRSGHPVAVLGVDQVRQFGRRRRALL